MAALQLYISKVASAADKENGKQLAQLFLLEDTHSQSFLKQPLNEAAVESQCRRLDAPWDDMALAHVRAVVSFDQADHLDAFDAQKDVVQALQRSMSSLTRWCLPVLYVVNKDLKWIALKADEAWTVEDHRKKLEEAANVISKSFTYCITDRGMMSHSKKHGTYCMIGILFRIYFKVNERTIEEICVALKAADMPPLQDFPKSDRVTFRYYLGKLYFLEEDYAKAEHELSLAFRECANKSQKNKELILQILLPLRLMRGILPSQALLARFPDLECLYGPITLAIKRGDLQQFNASLVAAEPALIHQGTYLAVEKVQSITMRQLFRKVFVLLNYNTRIPFALFKRALDWVGLQVDMEECEWMLATLIHKGYMKGYLSHEKSFLVLSKADPFPAVHA
ncbi:PCI-domain-containing protein [Spinellus fusiger]|nr:PCI-domain-containing protein [Spinellus fusiger]